MKRLLKSDDSRLKEVGLVVSERYAATGDIANAPKAFWVGRSNERRGGGSEGSEHRECGEMHPAGFIISIGVEMSV